MHTQTFVTPTHARSAHFEHARARAHTQTHTHTHTHTTALALLDSTHARTTHCTAHQDTLYVIAQTHARARTHMHAFCGESGQEKRQITGDLSWTISGVQFTPYCQCSACQEQLLAAMPFRPNARMLLTFARPCTAQ